MHNQYFLRLIWQLILDNLSGSSILYFNREKHVEFRFIVIVQYFRKASVLLIYS